MAGDYNWFLDRAVKTVGQVAPVAGGSGYFSRPDNRLDPRLFVGKDRFDPTVRHWILNTLYSFWEKYFKDPKEWSTAWVAGSGITYQWAASRSNGDLDVLIGVDFPRFFRRNPEYVGFGEEDMADMFNRQFKEMLWPATAAVKFPSNAEEIPGTFEVTFYVNPHSTNIRDIKPYAAYDLTHDSWTVRPPILPEDPSTIHPAAFYESVAREQEQAREIIDRYNQSYGDLNYHAAGTPGYTNAINNVSKALRDAKEMFDNIHLGRKNAFGPHGEGFGDFYNFRWQAHKQAGTMQALANLSKSQVQAKQEAETNLYGHPLIGARQALNEAALAVLRYGR